MMINKIPPKQHSYSTEFQLQVIKLAAEHGNCAANHKFGAREKLVRDWRMVEVMLTTMKRLKKMNHGSKARWPALEKKVKTWVLEERAEGRRPSTVQLRFHAIAVAKEMDTAALSGGPPWCFRFMLQNVSPSKCGRRCARSCPLILKRLFRVSTPLWTCRYRSTASRLITLLIWIKFH